MAYFYLKEEWREMYTLDQVPVGDTVVVKKIYGEGRTRRRIMDMGLTRGISVLVRRVAPLGDPIELKVRGYELSIRKTEAAAIEVEEPDIH